MKTSLLSAVMLAIIPGLAAAQKSGTISDARMIVERPGFPPDTSVVHTYSVGTRFRSEYVSGKKTSFPGAESATTQIMILGDSGMKMYFIDSVAKTYSEFQPGGMLKGAMEMLKSIGSDMKMKMNGDSAALDSLGDGGIVAGYRTLHFRTRFSSQMSFSMMNESFSVGLIDTVDTYVAPALKQTGDSAANWQTREDMKRALGASMPFDIGNLMGQVSVDAGRIADAGVPVKTVISVSTKAMGRNNSQRMTTEVLKFKRSVLPDSLFQVPAGYKKVDPMMGFHPDSSGS